MHKLIQILFGIFLFTFPFSMRFLLYESAAYRFGHFNPWVSGFVYLPELLLGIVFVLWFIQKIRDGATIHFRHHLLWLLLALFALNLFVITIWRGDALFGAFFWLRLFEVLVVIWLIEDELLTAKQMVTILLGGAVLQVAWALGQWQANQSLGLSFLGESTFSADQLGVAKVESEEGLKHVRAYGSFLHPNILAAYLLIVFFVILDYLRGRSHLFWLAVFSLGIYLTQSRAAVLMLVVGLALYYLFTIFESQKIRKAFVFLLILVLTISNAWFFKNSHLVSVREASFQERLTQNAISKQMYYDHPLGVGVSNFTLQMEQFTDRKLLPWEFQPVHNNYFLVLNEVGIQGLILMLLFLIFLFYEDWKKGKAIPLLLIILLAPFDHYFWDSWAGMMMVAIAAGFYKLENHTLLPDRDVTVRTSIKKLLEA